MINGVLFVAMASSTTWAITPRFFRHCDSVLTRRRLRTDGRDHDGKQLHLTSSSTATRTTTTDDFLSARGFNELARLTRAHVPFNDAIQHITSSTSSPTWKRFAKRMDMHELAEEVLVQLAFDYPFSLSVRVLMGAISNNNFVPAALDHGAMAIRDHERTLSEITLATAQSQLTMRILTRVPLALFGIALVVSDSLRRVVTSPALFALLTLAMILNRVGAAWSTLLVRRLHRPTSTDEILHLVTVLSVNVRAGGSLPSACQQLRGVSAIGDVIANPIRNGVPFEEALLPLTHHDDRFAHDIAALLITAYRDGQPALETINILSHEARRRREQQTQTLIRKLPVQLTAPIVLCVLPSFILLVVVPLMIAQLNALSSGFTA